MIYMKILSHMWQLHIFGGVCLQKYGFFNSHRFSVISSWIFLLPDIPLNKFMHEDKCCTLGLGCCLNRALFRWLLLDYNSINDTVDVQCKQIRRYTPPCLTPQSTLKIRESETAEPNLIHVEHSLNQFSSMQSRFRDHLLHQFKENFDSSICQLLYYSSPTNNLAGVSEEHLLWKNKQDCIFFN